MDEKVLEELVDVTVGLARVLRLELQASPKRDDLLPSVEKMIEQLESLQKDNNLDVDIQHWREQKQKFYRLI